MVYAMFFCIITGILFVISTIRMGSVKKWMKVQINVLEKKKSELDELINSSSDMVNELNSISDYVAELIGNRTEELNGMVKAADEKITECKNLFEQTKKENIVEFPNKNISEMVTHSRKEEIEELYNEGYSVSEIARELNIGKGEIELMLGITERYLRLAN
jgi:DNA-binding NarL/FixJ family response regulator